MPRCRILRYAADLRSRWPGVAVTVAPAQFCGYSSQLLSGTVAGPGGVAFADRIAHVWTNTKSFLVVVHLEGPVGAPGFDAAKATTNAAVCCRHSVKARFQRRRAVASRPVMPHEH